MNRNDERKYFERKYGVIPEDLLKPFSFETNGNIESAVPAGHAVKAIILQNETENYIGGNKAIDLINRNMKTMTLT